MTLQRALRRVPARRLGGLMAAWAFHRLTCPWRALPDFIIIGAQRSGTTSLYNYILEHPCVMPALIKETHFFDNNYHKGLLWYRSFFPLARQIGRSNSHSAWLTGESTPYYLFHPAVPQRVQAALPAARLIVLLRNPVDRAYSHYQHEVKLGLEQRTFEQAIQSEASELAAELNRLMAEDQYQSFSYQNFSYLSRGIYIDQIERWEQFFQTDQILVLQSEALFSDPGRIMAQVFKFLQLEAKQSSSYQKYNLIDYQQMPLDTRKFLDGFYEPYNQRLYAHLTQSVRW